MITFIIFFSGLSAFFVACIGIMIERRLTRQRDELRAMLFGAGDALLGFDDSGRCTQANQAAAALVRRPPKEIIGRHCDEVFRSLTRRGAAVSLWREIVSRVIKDSDIVTFLLEDKFFFNARGGARTAIPIGMTVSPVRSVKGTGAVAVFRDLSAEDALDKSKSDFLALASHQLRTPLTTIRWYAELTEEHVEKQKDDNLSRGLREIRGAAERMEYIVRAMLLIAEIETAKAFLEEERVSLRAQARAIVAQIGTKLARRKPRITVSFLGHYIVRQMSTRLFSLVCSQFLSNAIKYSRPGGIVRYMVDCSSPTEIRVTVSDAGYGISKKNMSGIGTKFFRGENIRDKDTDGTGLGLYMVKRALDTVGGAIEFSSEENIGSTFTAVIPAPRPLRRGGLPQAVAFAADMAVDRL